MSNFEKLAKESKQEWVDFVHAGEPIIYFGMASCGKAAGAEKVREAVEKKLAKDNISAKLVNVGCIGPCYLEPLMDISVPGMPRISYANVTPELAIKIIEEFERNGSFVTYRTH